MIDFSSYEWHRGKKPEGVDTYAVEIHLKSGRSFEEVRTADFAEMIADTRAKYGDQIKKIYIGV